MLSERYLDAFREVCPTGEEDECWMWNGSRGCKKYGVFSRFGEAAPSHRASYAAFNGPLEKGKVVRHTCDTPGCVNPRHLVLGTYKQNTDDMLERGRVWRGAKWVLTPEQRARGERSSTAKLTEDKVREIRMKRANGTTLSALAGEHGVTRQAISAVVRRVTWTHVE